jgi:uncharacterized protein (DUF58 family)
LNLRPWIIFLLFIFIVALFLGNTWLIVFSAAIIVILGLAYLYARRSLTHLFYRRHWQYKRGFPGEKTQLQLEIENRKILPITWLRISDHWPLAIHIQEREKLSPFYLTGFGQLVHIFSMKWFEQIQRKYTLTFEERGVYPIGPVDLTSGDLFGLYENSRQDPNQDYLIVYPEILALQSFNPKTLNPLGENKSKRRLYEDPNRPMGVRAYHPEDDFRRIHWPATARTGNLQVKVYQPVSSKVVVICLNISTSEQSWLGTDRVLFEHLVKVAATLVYKYIDDGYAVGLVSNCALAYSDRAFQIPPSTSTRQLILLLETLARVTPFVTTPFETFLGKALTQMPFGASLVIISALNTPELFEALMRVKRYRSNTTLVSLDANNPPELPGIHAIHMPFIPEPEEEAKETDG